jgi:proteasome accessory factor B
MLLKVLTDGGAAAGAHFVRPPWERMCRLHALLQEGKYPNCAGMGRELEVSAKTIQRDLNFMRDRLELPIAYEPSKFGYYYTQPVDSLPSLDMSEGELVSLLIAQKALHQHHGTAYEGPLRSACAKISEAMKGRVSVDINDLASRVFFKPESSSEVQPAVFETVGLAVRESRELSFLYRKLGGEVDERRRIRPYHLGCVNNQWYVFGWDVARKEMRTFALPRLRRPEVLEKRFERPRDFSIEAFLSDSLGVFSSQGEVHVVKIRFTAWAAQLVRERAWHSSQKQRELPGGEVELELRLSSLLEVERWILSFGVHARVLQPAELVRSLRERIASMAALYSGEHAASFPPSL